MCLILFIYSKNLLKMSKNFKSTKGQKVACSQCGWHGHRASMSMHWQDAHRAKMDQFKSKQRWVPISNSTKLEIKCKHYIIIFWLNIIIVCTVETYKSWQGKSLQNFKLLLFFGDFCRHINRYDFFGSIFCFIFRCYFFTNYGVFLCKKNKYKNKINSLWGF